MNNRIFLAATVLWVAGGLVSVAAQPARTGVWEKAKQLVPRKNSPQIELIQQQINRQILQAPTAVMGPGLTNVYKISPRLYRGGQPTEEGYRTLAGMGIKAIVSFRATPPDEKLITELGMTSYHIPINPFLFRDKHARQFLEILDKESGPVYIHCLYGSDRTGAMVALYRMVYENWTRTQALREMQNHRFGFHEAFANLVYYIERVQLYNVMPRHKPSSTYAQVSRTNP